MKKVYSGVDFFKLCAAIGVISIHTEMPFLQILGRLGVPFFVIISSFFFFKHYFSLNGLPKRKKYLIKFEKRMGLLIFCWQIIYIPLAIEYFKRIVINNHTSVIKYIYYFIYPGYTNANGWGQSWYLIAMLIGLPLFVYIYELLDENIIPLAILSIILELYYILSNEFGFLTKLPLWGTLYFPRLIIYILIGLILAKKKKIINNVNNKKILFILIGMVFLFVTENLIIKMCGGIVNSEEVITTVPTSIVLTIFSLNFNLKIGSTVKIRNCSTFLYCVQNYPLQIFIKLFQKYLVLAPVISRVIFFIFVVTISLALFYLYLIFKKKYKFLNYLV